MSKAEELADKLNSLCVAEFAWPYLNDAATELRRLHAANVYTSDLCTQALDDVRRLAAENEALKADAERYRWIRVNGEPDEGMNYRSDWTPEMYDAAIDSAMKENPHG